jgi:hypothetical protein
MSVEHEHGQEAAPVSRHPVLDGIANSSYARVGAPSAILAMLVWIGVQVHDLTKVAANNRNDIHTLQTWKEVHTALHERDDDERRRAIVEWQEREHARDEQHKLDRELWLERVRKRSGRK